MISLQCNKGQTCKIKPVLCQEGYCSECFIYQSKFSRLETTARVLSRSYTSEGEMVRSDITARRNSYPAA
jgi:hypothetical protein